MTLSGLRDPRNSAPSVAAPDGASNKALAELTDFELDRKIGAKIQMIGSALKGRDRAVEAVERCEKSAVLSAWLLGQFLIEKKSRLTHGGWLPWLDSAGISASSASDYTRIANQIASAGNLKSSIRATLQALPAPAAAKPKSVPVIVPVAVKVVEPAPAKPKTIAVKIVEPAPVWPTERDSASMVENIENELYAEREKNEALEERIAIMEEASNPKSRKAVDKLNNQAELIQTLKASVADWQSKAGAARKEITMLKRKIKTFEKEAA